MDAGRERQEETAVATKTEWQGRVGESWARNADAQDGKMELLGREAQGALAGALGGLAGRRVLDLGCGAGATSFQLEEAGALVTGLDVSAPLLEAAEARRAARGSRAEFVLADAAEWQAEAPYDALYSRCGAMFFDDPKTAYSNLRAQMLPGAPMAIAAWAEREKCFWGSLPPKILSGLLDYPPSTPPGQPGPFGWSVIEPILAMLAEAGWRAAMARRFDHVAPLSIGDDPDPVERGVLSVFRIGTSAKLLSEAPPEVQEDARARLREGLAPYVQDGAVRLPASCWIVTAQA